MLESDEDKWSEGWDEREVELEAEATSSAAAKKSMLDLMKSNYAKIQLSLSKKERQILVNALQTAIEDNNAETEYTIRERLYRSVVFMAAGLGVEQAKVTSNNWAVHAEDSMQEAVTLAWEWTLKFDPTYSTGNKNTYTSYIHNCVKGKLREWAKSGATILAAPTMVHERHRYVLKAMQRTKSADPQVLVTLANEELNKVRASTVGPRPNQKHLEWAKLYTSGISVKRIAQRYGVTTPAIRYGLRMAGKIESAARIQRDMEFTAEEVMALVNLYAPVMTIDYQADYDDVDDSPGDTNGGLLIETVDPEWLTQNKEFVDKLFYLIRQNTFSRADMIMMQMRMDGHTDQEIATKLNWSIGKVRARRYDLTERVLDDPGYSKLLR